MTSPTIPPSQFWGFSNLRLSPASLAAFEDNASCYITVSRTRALFQLALSHCSPDLLASSKGRIQSKMDRLLKGLTDNVIEIHVPALTALLVKRYLEIEGENPIAWDRLLPIVTACFCIASGNLDDIPLDTRDSALLFDIPRKTLDWAIVEVLNRLNGYRPTIEEVERFSARLDEIGSGMETGADTDRRAESMAPVNSARSTISSFTEGEEPEHPSIHPFHNYV